MYDEDRHERERLLPHVDDNDENRNNKQHVVITGGG